MSYLTNSKTKNCKYYCECVSIAGHTGCFSALPHCENSRAVYIRLLLRRDKRERGILFRTEWYHNTAGVICGCFEYICGKDAKQLMAPKDPKL